MIKKMEERIQMYDLNDVIKKINEVIDFLNKPEEEPFIRTRTFFPEKGNGLPKEKKTLSDKSLIFHSKHPEAKEYEEDIYKKEDIKEFIKDILRKVNRTQSMKEVWDFIKERAGKRLVE